MIDDVFDAFSWSVHKPGYVWLPSKGKGYVEPTRGQILVEAPSGKSDKFKLVSLDNDLFLKFAHVEPTLEGIRRFANKFGFLGITAQKHDAKVDRGSGETYHIWKQEIKDMKDLITLWAACQANERDVVAEFIHRTKEQSIFFQAPVSKGDAQQEPIPIPKHKLPAAIPEGDLVVPATYFIRRRLSKKLENANVHPRMFWRRDEKEGNGAFRLSLQTPANNLHQMLWLQAVESVTSGQPFKSCQECKCWFAIPLKAPRGRTEFCSEACRVRAYRYRQACARQMAADGKSFAVIAKEIGSDLETVKKWVTGRRGK